MRAISLWQPWASLVAGGAKRIETRSWQTPHRGWLAIHATKAFPSAARMLCYMQPITAALQRMGYDSPDALPRSAILALVHLDGCTVMTEDNTPHPGSAEYAYGDYSVGRVMWLLSRVHCLGTPLAAPGKMGLWDWTPPADADELHALLAELKGPY